MRGKTSAICIAAGLFLAGASFAQAPAGAPTGSTGQCKDGSYWSGPTKKGACHGHQGVQTWYGAAASPAPAAAPAAASNAKSAVPAPAAAAAPGGGPGQVWVNTKTKVYHCQSDRWYGKTKDGSYMTEAAATAAGFHAEHGKACH